MAELIAGFSHEINNPLNAVQGIASLLKKDVSDPQAQEDLQILEEESTRAIGAVHHLRNLARMLGDTEGPLDLTAAADSIVKVRSYEMGCHGVSLSLQSDRESLLVSSAGANVIPLLLMLELSAEKVAFRSLEEAENQKQGITEAEILLKTSSSAGGPCVDVEVHPAIAGNALSEVMSEMTALQDLLQSAGAEVQHKEESGREAGIRLRLPAADQ